MTTATKPTNLVDAEPVRQHIRALYAAGFTDFRLSNLAATSPATIHALGQRPYPKRSGRRHRVNADLADRILDITPATHAPGRTSAAGAHRRMQALVAAGWPISHIGARAGMSPHNADRILRRPTLNASTNQAIAAAYEELRHLRPERAGVPAGAAKRARNHARARRWAPPAYWDHPDHPIDDPQFQPEYGVLSTEILAGEARWLIGGGLTVKEAAKRLGKSVSYIEKSLTQHPADDGQAAA